jgi:hypothetical protein
MTFKSAFASRICLLLFSVLMSCPLFAQTQNEIPLVRVGKTAAAPVIDGKLDDAAWKQSVTVGDFSGLFCVSPKPDVCVVS